MTGEVEYSQYHKGKYLVAWHPKSSVENERHTVVIKSDSAVIMVKQIAGAVAKRIVNYLKVGQVVEQGAGPVALWRPCVALIVISTLLIAASVRKFNRSQL